MRSLSIASLVVIAACVGGAPPDRSSPDGGGDAGAPPSETARVHGQTLDHFVPGTPIPAASVASDAIEPAAQTTSSDEGDYVLEPVPIGSKLVVTVSHAGYRATRSSVGVGSGEVTQDLALVSIADARRQYVTLGRTPSIGKAIAIASLEDEAGMPVAGLLLSSIALVDATGAPVPGVLGPFAFGPAGDIDPALTTSAIAGGRARVILLDLPPGAFALQLATLASEPIAAAADGAVVVRVRVAQPPAPNLDPGFATDIHPRLQTAANGGLGCANCHTLGGSGAVLELDGPPELVLERIKARAGVVDIANVAASALLTRPLYEPAPAVQNHPNAAFLDANDPDYQLIRRWIAGGTRP